MNLKSIELTPERTDILRTKRIYGIWYGIVVGLSFAFFSWGIDSYILSNYHGFQPWLKFGVGAVLCMIPGGLAGWLSAKVSKPIISIFFWLIAASVFAWLTVYLPIVILPKALTMLEPQLSELLHYVYYDEFNTRVSVGYIWLAIFITITAILQIPLSDSAVFSTSAFSKLIPLIIAVILMSISGMIVDNGMINAPLRSSTVAIDSTIQFIIDHRGKEMDKTEARRMHVGAFRAIDDSVTQQRELIVSGYDDLLGEVNVLAHFERDWVECLVAYNQPIRCTVIDVAQ